jgi:hypothetical protein
MRIKFIYQLVYIGLIITTLLSSGCLETDQISDVLTQIPQDTDVVTTEPEPLDAGEGLAIGATAPAFSLPGADGNSVSLSDYAGQKVALVFYATGG